LNRPPASFLRELQPADTASLDGAASFLQSGFWGAFKARFGWAAQGFIARWGLDPAGTAEVPLLVMRRRLGPGFSFAYVPWGPELPAGFPPGAKARTRALTELAQALRGFLPLSTAFIRFDPPWYDEGPPLEKPLFRAAADIQPPDSVLVGLRGAEADILGAMKPKWRYNIRLAEKRGVTVRRADEAGLPVFYRLFQETGCRDGIAIHSAAYYETLFALSREYSGGADLRLYLAEHEGEALAAVIVLFRSPAAVYLYGASSDRKRNLMAPYALQWQAMRDAKAALCSEYDLFGIPPTEDPDHPMAGLYRFKTGFGGRIIHRPGSWDYPYRPLLAGLFRAAESVRKLLRDRKKAGSRE
jgi:lipid II:glycine glycyltransferase (peptidoglycan interpeptide bridge formation enzyme)